LGIPLSVNYLKAKDYSELIDRCREKIEGWMSSTLSLSGRVELIKTVLLGTIQYWIQSFKFPVSVITSLESMFSNFLWRKMHTWASDKICKPKKEEGLDIRRIKDINQAAGLKLVWRCCSNPKSV